MEFKETKPQIKAPRVTSLQSRASGGRIHVCPRRAYVGTKSRSVAFGAGVYTYAPQGIRVRGVENPQGFGIDERRLIVLFHREERNAQLHMSLNSEDIIRPGTRMTRIKRIYTDLCMPTLRDNTGRPAGSNVLAGTEAIIRCARSMLERGNRWKNPFGDGRAGERIIEILTNM